MFQPFSWKANGDSRLGSCISKVMLPTLSYIYQLHFRENFPNTSNCNTYDSAHRRCSNNRDFAHILFRAFRANIERGSIRVTSQRHLTDERWTQLCPCYSHELSGKWFSALAETPRIRSRLKCWAAFDESEKAPLINSQRIFTAFSRIFSLVLRKRLADTKGFI